MQLLMNIRWLILDSNERWELRWELESETFKWWECAQGFGIALRLCGNYKNICFSPKRFLDAAESQLTHSQLGPWPDTDVNCCCWNPPAMQSAARTYTHTCTTSHAAGLIKDLTTFSLVAFQLEFKPKSPGSSWLESCCTASEPRRGKWHWRVHSLLAW